MGTFSFRWPVRYDGIADYGEDLRRSQGSKGRAMGKNMMMLMPCDLLYGRLILLEKNGTKEKACEGDQLLVGQVLLPHIQGISYI